MRKIISFVATFLVCFSCVDRLERLEYNHSLKTLIEKIEKPFNGIVVDTISFRKGVKATHIVLSSGDTIFPTNGKVIESVSIGDYIYKYSKDNYVYVVRIKEKDTVKLWFLKISEKYRNDASFPEEWKNKWLEATFDLSNKNLNVDSIAQVKRIE